MVPELPFGTFRPGGQDYKRSVVTGHFSQKRPEKSCAIYFPTTLRVVPHMSSGIVERAKRERA